MRAAYLLILTSFYFKAASQLNPGFGTGFQPSKDIIVKFKIDKVTIKYMDTSNFKWDYYFDINGNDTALYTNNRLSWMKKYEKDKQGKIIRWIQYDSTRDTQYAADYTYELDGSYTVNITDEKYKVRIHSQTFNKRDKIESEFLMDGGQHIYKYDSLDRLSRIDSKPGLDGYNQYAADYNYNSNGILISVKTVFFLLKKEVLNKFYYSQKGLLIKSEAIETSSYDDKKWIHTTIYSYIFR
jgi:hypothetical protein